MLKSALLSISVVLTLTLGPGGAPLLADEFSFEVEEFEKSSFASGGYAEAKWEHINLNENGAIARLTRYSDPVATLDRVSVTTQLNGSYIHDIYTLQWLLQASGTWEEDQWDDYADVFEAYATIKPSPNLTGTLGKKAYKWGKGYAWNPVGFINRFKDPNNPDEALEGYLTGEAEMVKSFSGDLQTLALTTVLLPVMDGVNEEFGAADNLNLATRLYLLYKNTDIDFLFYTGNSSSTRMGVDFSRNITTNFEIHGEYGFFPDLVKNYLEGSDSITRRKDTAHSYLFGIRYLSEFNLTSIVEYYHNGGGYSSDELSQFYALVAEGAAQYEETGSDSLLQMAGRFGQQGYTKPYLGTDYLYGRFSLKEPGDILYFTPALTAIYNVDDQSYSLTPELLYTGFTNWELRLRFSLLGGGSYSEYGEKQNHNKVELRLRWFF